MDFIERILMVIDIPFEYLRKITLPPCEQDTYSRIWGIVFPAPSLMLILYCIEGKIQLWHLSVVPIGLVFSFLIYRTSRTDIIPK